MTTAQLDILHALLQWLEELDISWRLSPNGALLQVEGRMIAMALLNGTELTVSPRESDDGTFDLATAGGRDGAVQFIASLKEAITEVTSDTSIPIELLA